MTLTEAMAIDRAFSATITSLSPAQLTTLMQARKIVWDYGREAMERETERGNAAAYKD